MTEPGALRIVQDLFFGLRSCGASLGVDEYVAVVRALQAGIGLDGRDSLLTLCSMLWAKTDQERLVLRQCFFSLISGDRVGVARWAGSAVSGRRGAGMSTSRLLASRGLSDPVEAARRPRRDEPGDLDARGNGTDERSAVDAAGKSGGQGSHIQRIVAESRTVNDADEVAVAEAVTALQLTTGAIRARQFVVSDYVPVSARQMKQTWRYLRLPSNVGMRDEIDVEKTVESYAKHAAITETVSQTKKMNRARLALLVDRGGSMVPFHPHARRLIQTATREGRFDRVDTLYFHNCPAEFLFADEARQRGMGVDEVLTGFAKDTPVC